MKKIVLLFYITLALLAMCYTWLLLRNTDFTVQDIGRHIMNGQEIVHGRFDVLYHNTYSYVIPQHPFVNHHWLSGVVFYLVFHALGITGLYILHTSLFLCAAILVFIRMKMKSSLAIATFIMPLYVIFLSSRLEIRPEAFSYVFFNISLLIMDQIVEKKRIELKHWFFLVLMQLFWVNMHISFIFGIFIPLVYLCVLIVHKTNKYLIKQLILMIVLLVFVSCINPNGVTGLLYPVSLFTDYGYTIVENMSLWYLHDKVLSTSILLYAALFPLVITVLFTERKHVLHQDYLLAFVGLIMGFIALRNIPLYVFFVFPFLSLGFLHILRSIRSHELRLFISSMKLSGVVMLLLLFPTLFFSRVLVPSFSPQNSQGKIVQNQFASSDFYKSLHIKGHMFNNYDIGSFLVYALYPQTQVFVDNRPEAFGKDFFQNIYIPMQLNDDTWKKEMSLHDFQSIYWGYRDITEWSQIFLSKRLNDPEWVMVYVDDYAVIFVKNTQEHASIISQYKVSKEKASQYFSY